MDQIAHILNNHVGGIMDSFVAIQTQTKQNTEDLFSEIISENELQRSDLTYSVAPEQKTTVPVEEIKKTVYAIQDKLHDLLSMLDGASETYPKPKISSDDSIILTDTGEQIIEGVFNGEKMIGPDGQQYNVPPNYASKSKLVEGDLMKLTIRRDGKFMYKQIGPIDRKRVIGVLHFDEQSQLWSVEHQERQYKILTASATFYKGKPGDEVIILLPQDCQAVWGAVENIILK